MKSSPSSCLSKIHRENIVLFCGQPVSIPVLVEFCKHEMRDRLLGFAERKVLVSPSVVNGDELIFSGLTLTRYLAQPQCSEQNIVHGDARNFCYQQLNEFPRIFSLTDESMTHWKQHPFRVRYKVVTKSPHHFH